MRKQKSYEEIAVTSENKNYAGSATTDYLKVSVTNHLK